MTEWRDRIVGQGKANPSELMANPLNWRVHPTHQRHALKDALEEVGWVQQVVVNRVTGHLIDGHLRVDLAAEEGAEEVPVLEVELTEEEEKLVLATLDPLAALAVPDATNLNALLEGIDAQGQVLRGFLDDLQQQVGPAPDAPLANPDPSDFWPRFTIQVPPNVYSELRDEWERVEGRTDSEKAAELVRILQSGPETQEE